jgi:hypothetical protein
MRKYNLIYTALLILVLAYSCDSSDADTNDNPNQDITISISDFIITIDENPNFGESLGLVNAVTNQGNISFSITEQSPAEAIDIDAFTGEISVLTEALFDYETNPIISGTVRAENNGVFESANILINLNDINETNDDFDLFAVSDLGEVFTIGNNTGNIESVGQIDKENSNSILPTTTLIATDDTIYAVEYVYNPSPTNNLLIYDKQTGSTEIVPLILPSTINGDEPGLIALASDGSNLIGVVAENVLITGSVKHIVSISLQDNSIADTGITFNEDAITSIKKIDSKLYLSTWNEGFMEVDLVANSVTNNPTINGSRLAVINSTEIAVMENDLNFVNGAKPGIINLVNQSISDNSSAESYGLVTVFGNSIVKNQTYYNLVSSSSLDLYLGILKTDFESNENTIIEINSTTVNRNLIIVDGTNG